MYLVEQEQEQELNEYIPLKQGLRLFTRITSPVGIAPTQ